MAGRVVKRLSVLCAAAWGSLAAGCHQTGIPLRDLQGNQWVWPYFAHDQPTVLAFWNTYEMQCIEDIPALNTLEHRGGSVQLLSVCTNLPEDRAKVNKWCEKENVQFTVILDPEGRLARTFGVKYYPTYILVDTRAREVARRTDIRTVHNFFDRPRWVERAAVGEGEGSPQPSAYP